MERIKWIDVAKGWGIILVIYGHVTNDYFSSWLYTFHMPLFFFLSGYFFNPLMKPFDFFRSKVKRLLLPYVILGIPIFFIDIHYGFNPLRLLFSFIIQQRASTLWFIGALFMQFVIAYFIYHYISRIIIRWCIVLILTFFGLFLWRCGVTSLPWNTDVSMVALPFFCLGHDIRNKSFFHELLCIKSYSKYVFSLFIINLIGTIIMCNIPYSQIDLCEAHFSFEPIAYITAFAGIFFVCVISNKFYLKYIAYIGKNSLVFFAWQQDIAIMIMLKILGNFHIFDAPKGIGVVYRNIILVIGSLILLTILNEIIVRTKLKVLIGK